MSEPLDLSIIVVSFNTREVTLECLRSVYAETKETPFELIVVDNDSGDGSAAAIEAEFPDLKLLALEQNIGFGAANNLAAEHANGELLLLLNPDTVVFDNAVDELVRFARARPNAGIWGGRTLFADRSLNPTSCWRGQSLPGLFFWSVGLSTLFPNNPVLNSQAYGGWQRDTIREVDTVTGCFFLIRRCLWEKLEGFDSAFYMYGEEADLCLRARKIGARPTFTPDAVIIHYGGLSETIPADKIERLMRAKVTLANKHWSPLGRLAARQLFKVLAGARALGYGLASYILKKQVLCEKALIWRQVWTRRSEWLRGYT